MGIFISERFKNADVRPGISGISACGSRFETWLAMKMHAVFAGTSSRPSTAMRIPATR